MANVINWFEIPAKDFDRACKFYSEVLNGPIEMMEPLEGFDERMGFLPGFDKSNGVGGAICWGEHYVPSTTGSLVYLNGGDDLSVPLSRVESAGGKVVLPKTAIGENGFIAQFMDSEGNKVAFHSMA
ncbi:MAG: VOC family protein [Flavobacteriales bacterium]|nr:VOC family protein [Flavobacteriales bacterium]